MTPTHDLTLETVDRDGALRESAEKVAGDTRARFIAKAAGATGALVGGGLLLAGPAAAQSGGLSATDKDILNFALTLEELEAAFYAEAIAKGKLSGQVLAFAKVAGGHEKTHVSALRRTLGSDAIAKPTFDFKGTTGARSSFLTTAVKLEDTGVEAYKGQAPLVQSDAVLAVALSIHSIEAKHAAWVRRLSGLLPTRVLSGIENPATKAEVLAAVKATGFITG